MLSGSSQRQPARVSGKGLERGTAREKIGVQGVGRGYVRSGHIQRHGQHYLLTNDEEEPLVGWGLLGFPLKKSAGANAKGSGKSGFPGSLPCEQPTVGPEVYNTVVTHRESRFDLGQKPSLWCEATWCH